MAVTTAELAGSITDVVGDLEPKYLARLVLTIEANTPGSLLLDTVGNRVMAGAKRVTIDTTSGAYTVTLVKTNSTDITPATGRLYRATLVYPSGIPGAGNQRQTSGWFELTADTSLDAVWTGLDVIAVTEALYASISDSVAAVKADRAAVEAVVATNEGIMTSVLGAGGTFDTELAAVIATQVPDASDTVKGRVELATTAETTTGTDTVRAVTPAGVKAASDLLVPKWRATTAYTAGDTVLAPDGSLVKANATFTSGASYSSANWTPVSTKSGTQEQAALANAFAPGAQGPSAAQSWNLIPRPLVTDFPVPTFRPTQTNTPMAVDIMPNGTGLSSGVPAWIDICDTDIRDQVFGTTGTSALWLYIDSEGAKVASKRLGGSGTKLPLFLQAAQSQTGGVVNAIRISPAASVVATADDYTMTTDPYIVLGVHGGSVVGGSGYRLKAAADIGFFYIPRINGTPTGVPKVYGKTHAMAYDPGASKLWLYDGVSSTWKGVVLS